MKTYWTVDYVNFGMDRPSTVYCISRGGADKFCDTVYGSGDPVRHTVKPEKYHDVMVNALRVNDLIMDDGKRAYETESFADRKMTQASKAKLKELGIL